MPSPGSFSLVKRHIHPIMNNILDTHVLRHRHAGNGWCKVQDISEDYCRIAMLGKDKIDDRAFLAHKGLLKPEKELPEEIRPQVDSLRKRISEGILVVKSSHIVDRIPVV